MDIQSSAGKTAPQRPNCRIFVACADKLSAAYDAFIIKDRFAQDIEIGIGRLGITGFLCWDRPAGEVVLSAECIDFAGSKLRFVAEPNVTYFVRATTFAGWGVIRRIELEHMEKKEGQRLIAARSAPVSSLLWGETIAGLVSSGPEASTTDGFSPSFIGALLCSVSEDKSTETVEKLVAQGIDINHQESDKDSVLISVSARGDASMVKTLLAKGVDPNRKGFGGRNAFDAAIQNLRHESERVLFESGWACLEKVDTNSGGFDVV